MSVFFFFFFYYISVSISNIITGIIDSARFLTTVGCLRSSRSRYTYTHTYVHIYSLISKTLLQNIYVFYKIYILKGIDTFKDNKFRWFKYNNYRKNVVRILWLFLKVWPFTETLIYYQSPNLLKHRVIFSDLKRTSIRTIFVSVISTKTTLEYSCTSRIITCDLFLQRTIFILLLNQLNKRRPTICLEHSSPHP